MGRHAKVRPVSGKDKGVSCGQAAISEVLYPTTTTTSEAASESVTPRSPCHQHMLVNKQVLESVVERDRISTRESCALEWFNRQFHIRGGKGFGHGTGFFAGDARAALARSGKRVTVTSGVETCSVIIVMLE